MNHDDWHFWVAMKGGGVTLPVFQSLAAFWPGLLSLTGDNMSAMKSIHNFHQVWKQYESYDSSYKISVGDASESPTVTICFSAVQSNMDLAFEYGKDFNLSYIVDLDLKNLRY